MPFFFGSDISKLVQKAGNTTAEEAMKKVWEGVGAIESLGKDQLDMFRSMLKRELDRENKVPKWNDMLNALEKYAIFFHKELK